MGIIPFSNSHSTKAARAGPYTIRGHKWHKKTFSQQIQGQFHHYRNPKQSLGR